MSHYVSTIMYIEPTTCIKCQQICTYPHNMSTKLQILYICCNAAIVWYTTQNPRNVQYGKQPIRRNPMFSFDEQQKQFEQVIDRTQAAYDFWTKAIFTTIKDIFNTTKAK